MSWKDSGVLTVGIMEGVYLVVVRRLWCEERVAKVQGRTRLLEVEG